MTPEGYPQKIPQAACGQRATYHASGVEDARSILTRRRLATVRMSGDGIQSWVADHGPIDKRIQARGGSLSLDRRARSPAIGCLDGSPNPDEVSFTVVDRRHQAPTRHRAPASAVAAGTSSRRAGLQPVDGS